ncbi:MAG: hypothetical protein IPM59_11610 [Chloracidobacterium sp.]|nr:hypothetical protein [Chloracidobacterium sp.]
MTEAVLEKEKCDGCGVDVREGTLFCYNCGARVAGQEPEAALEDAITAANNGHLPGDTDKLATAANERKRARVAHRKMAEYFWVPTTGENALLTLILAVLIAVFALVVVLLMVW